MLHLLTVTHLLAGMVLLPAGTHRPLYGRPGDAPVRLAAFHLDRDAVTRGDFLAFVRTYPEWRRGAVASRVADRGYLANWRADLDAGDATDRRRPVTGVSLHAAKAYCAALGRRLPTAAEWEYAAAASARARDAARDPRFIQQLVTTYASRAHVPRPVDSAATNAWGIRGMHDQVWEWVGDVVPDDAHDAHGATAMEHDPSCAGAAIGAIDPTNYAAFLRYAVRAGLTGRTTMSTLGFRCAA